mmetsp:Transcript_25085/g.30541  ORF Transcript_25085/g.30541 Transcript_25085/m.30541 type:complete len:160 (-) Transcript_25085:201-680(-)
MSTSKDTHYGSQSESDNDMLLKLKKEVETLKNKNTKLAEQVALTTKNNMEHQKLIIFEYLKDEMDIINDSELTIESVKKWKKQLQKSTHMNIDNSDDIKVSENDYNNKQNSITYIQKRNQIKHNNKMQKNQDLIVHKKRNYKREERYKKDSICHICKFY